MYKILEMTNLLRFYHVYSCFDIYDVVNNSDKYSGIRTTFDFTEMFHWRLKRSGKVKGLRVKYLYKFITQ